MRLLRVLWCQRGFVAQIGLYLRYHGVYASLTVRSANLPNNSYLTNRAVFQCKSPDIHVEFARGISRHDFESREPSNFYDEIKITPNAGSNDRDGTQKASLEHLVEVQTIIQGIVTVVEPKTIAATEAGNTAILNAEVSKLAALAAELTTGADEKRRELDSLRDRLTDDFLQKESDLKSKLEAENQKLEIQKADIQTQQDEFDDREHKHVRRNLRSEIIEEVSNILDRPSGRSYRNFWPLFGIALSLVGIAGLVFLVLQSQAVIAGIYSENRPPPSAAALGLLLYAVTWMRSLANQAREYENQLHRYSLDMTRASWTMETLMELSNDANETVSDLWLESVTKNLFDMKGSNRDDTNSLQALGALLNVTSEAEIGPEGPRFRLNRRAAKKAASQAGG